MCVFEYFVYFEYLIFVVIISANDCVKRLVSIYSTYYVWGTFNHAHSLNLALLVGVKG